MASGVDAPPSTPLSADEREHLEALESTESLADLEALTGTESAHDAYFTAKEQWRGLRARALAGDRTVGGLPGATVTVEGTPFHVHGVTHSGSDAERAYLREHVGDFLADGHEVYCEQGIRRMYFDDLDDVCEMDDYEWAMARCEDLGLEPRFGGAGVNSFDGFVEDVDSLTSQFRERAFELIDSGREVYGDELGRTLGDVASALFLSHEEMATGEDFEAFQLSRAAARDPAKLATLQRYYETTFLPQPIEREWLRRHDPELEILTHARNERMADYLVYHADGDPVHAVVGAAHQPGVRYYLEAIRDGRRSVDSLEPVGYD